MAAALKACELGDDAIDLASMKSKPDEDARFAAAVTSPRAASAPPFDCAALWAGQTLQACSNSPRTQVPSLFQPSPRRSAAALLLSPGSSRPIDGWLFSPRTESLLGSAAPSARAYVDIFGSPPLTGSAHFASTPSQQSGFDRLHPGSSSKAHSSLEPPSSPTAALSGRADAKHASQHDHIKAFLASPVKGPTVGAAGSRQAGAGDAWMRSRKRSLLEGFHATSSTQGTGSLLAGAGTEHGDHNSSDSSLDPAAAVLSQSTPSASFAAQALPMVPLSTDPLQWCRPAGTAGNSGPSDSLIIAPLLPPPQLPGLDGAQAQLPPGLLGLPGLPFLDPLPDASNFQETPAAEGGQRRDTGQLLTPATQAPRQRSRRPTAGNRMRHLLQQAEEDEEAMPAPQPVAVKMEQDDIAMSEQMPAESDDTAPGSQQYGRQQSLPGLQPQNQAKRCNCKKSQCLKLYCDCFSAQVFCQGCACASCKNTPAHAALVQEKQVQIKNRDPLAFEKKIQANKDAGQAQHKKGCNCKKSNCLKKYCECFQGSVVCGPHCKCLDCRNTVSAAAAPPAKTSSRQSSRATSTRQEGSWISQDNVSRARQVSSGAAGLPPTLEAGPMMQGGLVQQDMLTLHLGGGGFGGGFGGFQGLTGMLNLPAVDEADTPSGQQDKPRKRDRSRQRGRSAAHSQADPEAMDEDTAPALPPSGSVSAPVTVDLGLVPGVPFTRGPGTMGWVGLGNSNNARLSITGQQQASVGGDARGNEHAKEQAPAPAFATQQLALPGLPGFTPIKPEPGAAPAASFGAVQASASQGQAGAASPLPPSEKADTEVASLGGGQQNSQLGGAITAAADSAAGTPGTCAATGAGAGADQTLLCAEGSLEPFQDISFNTPRTAGDLTPMSLFGLAHDFNLASPQSLQHFASLAGPLPPSSAFLPSIFGDVRTASGQQLSPLSSHMHLPTSPLDMTGLDSQHNQPLDCNFAGFNPQSPPAANSLMPPDPLHFFSPARYTSHALLGLVRTGSCQLSPRNPLQGQEGAGAGGGPDRQGAGGAGGDAHVAPQDFSHGMSSDDGRQGAANAAAACSGEQLGERPAGAAPAGVRGSEHRVHCLVTPVRIQGNSQHRVASSATRAGGAAPGATAPAGPAGCGPGDVAVAVKAEGGPPGVGGPLAVTAAAAAGAMPPPRFTVPSAAQQHPHAAQYQHYPSSNSNHPHQHQHHQHYHQNDQLQQQQQQAYRTSTHAQDPPSFLSRPPSSSAVAAPCNNPTGPGTALFGAHMGGGGGRAEDAKQLALDYILNRQKAVTAHTAHTAPATHTAAHQGAPTSPRSGAMAPHRPHTSHISNAPQAPQGQHYGSASGGGTGTSTYHGFSSATAAPGHTVTFGSGLASLAVKAPAQAAPGAGACAAAAASHKRPAAGDVQASPVKGDLWSGSFTPGGGLDSLCTPPYSPGFFSCVFSASPLAQPPTRLADAPPSPKQPATQSPSQRRLGPGMLTVRPSPLRHVTKRHKGGEEASGASWEGAERG